MRSYITPNKKPKYNIRHNDIAYTMENKNKKKLKNLHTIMIVTGIPFAFLQWVTIILWIATGNYLPYVSSLPVLLIYAIWISIYYFKRVAYICPKCGEKFVPDFKQAFFAKHTPSLRKLKCPCCEHKGYCVEVYRREEV